LHLGTSKRNEKIKENTTKSDEKKYWEEKLRRMRKWKTKEIKSG
jgi:hypothetical protein